jgi:hypothetical protein
MTEINENDLLQNGKEIRICADLTPVEYLKWNNIKINFKIWLKLTDSMIIKALLNNPEFDKILFQSLKMYVEKDKEKDKS